LAKLGESDRAYELFQRVLPQIAFCLENMELYHHAEKLLLQARGIISGAVVRQATRTLHEADASHIHFLNAKVLALLDHFGFPRNPARKARAQPPMRGKLG
jgi:4-hydroxy-tetrahydrodipicolinate synthase